MRIAVVYEALSKGVELKDNELYKEMLEQYPYYQKRLAERKQAIETLRRQAKVSKQQNQDIADMPKAKYKFEQRFLDKARKRDEILTTAVESNDIDYFAKYSSYLEQYEKEVAELEAKASKIPT